MMTSITLRISLCFLFCAYLSSCVSLSKPLPDIRLHGIKDETVDDTYTFENGLPVLKMSNFTSSPMASEVGFMFKTEDDTHTRDYYNRFLDTPASLIQVETRRKLRQSNLPMGIVSSKSPLLGDFVLDGFVEEIYIDKRGSEPEAVIVVTYTLIESKGKAPTIVFLNTISSRMPVESENTSGYLQAWRSCLADIHKQLIERMMQTAEAKE